MIDHPYFEGLFHLWYNFGGWFTIGLPQPYIWISSGKRLHNYGKAPCYQWVNPLFLWSFSIAMLNYQRV